MNTLAMARAHCFHCPRFRLFGGGAHASHVIDIQDFMIVAVGAKSYARNA